MVLPKVWLWQKAPALRLLLACIAGILLQWYLHFAVLVIWILLASFMALLLIITLTPLRIQYKAAPLQGFALMGFIAATAMCMEQWNDVRNSHTWFSKQYNKKDGLLLTLQEPLIEKPNSYKALARIDKIIRNDSVVPSYGKALLYFKKDA